MPDLTALLAELGELHRKAEAQLAHREPILASRQSWTAMATGLRDTEALLWTTAGQIQPGWTDVAGQSYLDRMESSTAVVRAWAATLAGSGVEESMTGLAAEIDATVAKVRQLRQTADGLVAQLASIAGPFPDPVTAGNMTILAGVYLGQLETTVAEARAALAALDQAFSDAAGVVARTPAGVAWDGPAGADGAATTMGQAGGAGAGGAGAAGGAAGPAAVGATPGAAGGQPLAEPDLAGAGALPGGTGASGGAAPAAGPAGAAAPGAGGDPTGLARSAAPPAPVTGLAPGTIGGAGVAPPPAGPVPIIPPVGRPPAVGPVPGAGAPRPVLPGVGASRPILPGAGAPRPVLPGAGVIGGGGGRLGGFGVGTGAGVADTGATTIPRAAAPTGAVPTAGAGTPPVTGAAGTAAATAGQAGAGFVRPPLGMVPPLAAGLGAGGGTPTAGTADDRARGHRDRPLRAVPGVPPRLGGRAGSLDGPLPFVRPAAAAPPRGEDADQVLDDELWQVRRNEPDRHPIVDGHSQRGGT